FGFLAPLVTRRFGLERTAAVALGLTAPSLVLRALSPTTTALVASTVVALAGIGAANVGIVPLVKAWFPDRIALRTSPYLSLMQTGQFVAPLLAVPVADATTWRVSVGVWALPAAVAAAVWLVLAARLRPDHHAPASPTAAVARLRVGRSSTAWGLVVLFAAISLSNYGIITWGPAGLTDAGGSTALRGTMVGLYSAWRMAAALGRGVSTFPLCMTLINRRTRTPQSASAVSGFVQGIGYGLACLGPIGLGLLREATGSWTVPLLALAATAVPGVVGGWFACRPRFVEDTAPPAPEPRTATP